MFAKLATFTSVVLAITSLTAATPQLVSRALPASQCNTQPVQCCDSTFTEGSAAGAALLSSLGIPVQDVNALLGQGCSPLSVVGVGGESCSANPVCCQDNSHSVVSVSCVPVDLGL
ncbi:fungal hydrophobin [Cristinia sonorae]|uniref:Hydrophobin n=1 Tax=Cristinia sonorae TaxID=1940300 RepID=A0A8K0XMM3_9AGAR|nr:fungal hydrophobin [Cristinia sonorae]